jgi:fructose-bisphosphate aldolase class II
MLESFKKNSKTSIFIHLDHATDERQIMLALQCGIDSIMVDGSHLSFEENIKWTSSMASLIHLEGVCVEAKLGNLENNINNNNNSISNMTDPDQCKLFIKETRVDMLAVTIGDFSVESKAIDFERLKLINEEVGYFLPLVLHDTAGISIDNIKGAIDRGIYIYNLMINY